MPFPQDDGVEGEMFVKRMMEKKSMKADIGPYKPFEGYYQLSEVIDTFMEIWYKDSSSDEED